MHRNVRTDFSDVRCYYFCMFPVCPLCCFSVISMDLESEINDDDDDDDDYIK